jgi:hypothetical protein
MKAIEGLILEVAKREPTIHKAQKHIPRPTIHQLFEETLRTYNYSPLDASIIWSHCISSLTQRASDVLPTLETESCSRSNEIGSDGRAGQDEMEFVSKMLMHPYM